MAYARVSYTGDGSTKIFTVPFPYLAASYVEVRVAGSLKAVTTHYTWLTSSTIQFITAPAVGETVFILRNTPKESRLVNYQDAAILKEEDLDLDSDQAFHVVQEGLDAIVNSRTVRIFVAGTDYTPGVTTTLAIGDATVEEESLTILFDAAAQQHSEYSISGGTITFTSPIPTGVLQVEVAYAIPLATGLIDGSVTAPKIADGSLTNSKYEALSITQDKLAQAVFKDLTAVTPATGDYLALSDVSDLGNKKKSLVSDILALIPLATTSVAGIRTLATNSEALAATVTDKLLTPSNLSWSRSFSVNGYQQFPGTPGLILQWGRTSSFGDISGGSTSGTTPFPIAFPSAVLATVVWISTNTGSHPAVTVVWDYGSTTLSTLAFKYAEYGSVVQGTWYISFLALGY